MFKRYKQGAEETETNVMEQEKVTPLGPNRRTYAYSDEPTSQPRSSYSQANSNEPLPRIFESRATGPVGSRAATTMESPRETSESMDPFAEEDWEKPLPQTPGAIGSEQPETTLGEGVVFKGELSFKRLLRIDGHFEGELNSEGKLVVGSKGVVKSPSIKLREAIIEGRVEGNLTVEDRVELRGDAVVEGNIEAQTISVDEGVSIVGHVSVRPKVAPEPSHHQDD